MFCSNNCVLYLIITCSIHLRYASAETENILKPQSDNKQISRDEILIIDETFFNKGSIIYARCGKNSSDIIQCNIVEQNYVNENGNVVNGLLRPARHCSYLINDDHDLSKLNIRVTAIYDTVVLSWGNDTVMGVMNMKTCAMNQLYENKKSYFPNKIVPRVDGSFDVFFKSPANCGKKLCVIHFADDGTIKNQPVASNLTGGLIYYISLIATQSSSEAYVYLKKNEMDFALLLVKDDGTEKQLIKYDSTACSAVSASKNTVTACIKSNTDSDVTCTQYDGDGNIKFTTTVANGNEKIQPKVVYNLPNGGMLVMLAVLKKSDKKSSHNIENKYYLVKIAADGKIMGTTHIEEINDVVSEFKYAHICRNGDTGYCAIIIGQRTINDVLKPNDSAILIKCFNGFDFFI